MPDVTIVATGVIDDPGNPPPVERPHHPRSVIRGHAGTRIVLPYAPVPVDHSGFGSAWSVLSRGSARDPLLVDGDGQLRVSTFTLTIAHRDRAESVNPILRALEHIANTKERISWSYGRPETGVWQLTALSYTITARRPGNNEPTRAQANLTLTRVASGSDKPGHGGSGGGGHGHAGRSYTVKRGDTLWKLAVRFYGDGKQWKLIGKANHIRRPRKELKPGRKLVIPRVR